MPPEVFAPWPLVDGVASFAPEDNEPPSFLFAGALPGIVPSLGVADEVPAVPDDVPVEPDDVLF